MKKQSETVNIRTIAREAGVSPATVSLALRNSPNISSKTRERILEVTQRLQYRPNARVAELMGQIRRSRRVDSLSETVAMVWTDAPKEQVNIYPHLLEFEACARTSLALSGYGLDIFYHGETSFARLEKILCARGIRGVILAPLLALGRQFLDWDWNQFCLMIAGSGLWEPDFHRVRFNHFEETALILAHLHEQAAGKIGLILDKRVDVPSQRSILGSFLAYDGAGPVYEFTTNDHQKLLRWLSKTKPDTLIVSCSEAFFGIIESGFPVRLVLTNQHLHPEWQQYAGIRQDYGQLGQVAAEQLMAQLSLNQTGVPRNPLKIYFTGKWEDALAGQ